MLFYKTIHKKEVVFVVNNAIIDDELISDIISNSVLNKKIGIDMKNVSSIKSPAFIKYLLNNKIKLFNLQNEILTYLAIILKDGFLKSYINYSDFSENKRELVKRNFLVA